MDGGNDGWNYKKLLKDKPKGRERDRIISASASLGLTLAWHHFCGAEWSPQGWFGFTGTHTNVWLRFGRQMLLKCLLKHPDAHVRSPNEEEISGLKETVKHRHPALEDVHCGLKLYFEQSGDVEEQGMLHSGWQSDHFVTNLIVFSGCG
jgi:hypothetical protein